MEIQKQRELVAGLEKRLAQEKAKLRAMEQGSDLPSSSPLETNYSSRSNSNPTIFGLVMSDDLLKNEESYRNEKTKPKFSMISLIRQAVQESPERLGSGGVIIGRNGRAPMETGRKRKLEANQEEAPPKEEEKLQTTEQDLYLPNTSTLANSSNIRTPDSELRESNDHRIPTDLEKQLAMAVDLLENREFYRDRKELPPYSDIELMRQAIQESPKRRLPFKKIYNWIKDNFGYYQTTRYPQRTQNYLKRTLQYCDQFNLVRPNGQGLMWMLAEDFVALQNQGRAASLQ